MKKRILILFAVHLILLLTGCTKEYTSSGAESDSIKVYGNGSYSKALEEASDIIVMVSNGSDIDRVKMHGTLNGVEIFDGKYARERIVKQAGGYTYEHLISYYYISSEDREFSFYVEAGAVFCKESVSSEDNEQIWILFSYYKNEEEGEGIHATSSYSSMGFA